MPIMKRIHLYRVAAGAMSLLGLLAAAGQADDGFVAPEVESQFPTKAIIAIIICVMLLFLSVLKNPKRAHETGG